MTSPARRFHSPYVSPVPCDFAAHVQAHADAAVEAAGQSADGDTPGARARKNLMEFVLQSYPGTYHAGWFHRHLCARLEQFLADCVAKKSPRLMVFAPPRHGKSEIVSRRFPAWAFGKHPDTSIIAASHNTELAKKMNRDVQRIIGHPAFRASFPGVLLNEKSVRSSADGVYVKNTTEFEIVNRRGAYRCAGVGVGIAGFGADILIIDDPFRNAADANSKTVRDGVFEWFNADAATRLSPGGGILLMHTRWHMDDLAGRLLDRARSGDGDKWEVLSYPAIATEDEVFRKAGDPLHPERYDLRKLQDIRRNLGSYSWSALYQQSPILQDGDMFRREWFPFVDVPRRSSGGFETVRYWDRAGTLKTKANGDPDWTVGVKIMRNFDGEFFIVDVVRLRGTPLDVRRAIKNTAERDGYGVAVGIEQDPGQAGLAEAQDHARNLAGFDVRIVRAESSKAERAKPLSAQCEAGNVWIVRGLWNEAFLDELSSFPFGAHDDQVDAASGAFTMLTQRDVVDSGETSSSTYEQDSAREAF